MTKSWICLAKYYSHTTYTAHTTYTTDPTKHTQHTLLSYAHNILQINTFSYNENTKFRGRIMHNTTTQRYTEFFFDPLKTTTNS